jgi:hypothetical protein
MTLLITTFNPVAEDEVPFDQFDEWYAFDHQVQLNDLRPIVNRYSGPDSAEIIVPHFWQKLEKYQPALVFGAFGGNSSPWIVSRDVTTLDCIANWVRSLYPATP